MVKKNDNISGYTLIKQLGKGGQGNVWLAKKGNKEVALKFLNNASDKKALNRFEVEFQALKLLKDKRIIEVYKLYKEVTSAFPPHIVMSLIKGSDLETESIKGTFRLDILKSLLIFKEIIAAIKIAHENTPQIIHRDLKPANILLRKDGSPVVTDFGICLVIDDNYVKLTSINEEVGARNYIAPELRASFQDKPSPQSDIYSLGKVLYFMLSGGKIMDREEYAVSPFDLRKWDGCPKQMDYVYKRLFDKCINGNPKERFKSSEELINVVEKIIKLIEGKYSPAQPGRKCLICGEGEYGIFRPASGMYAGSFFVCNKCGNMQIFSIKYHEEHIRTLYENDPEKTVRDFNDGLPKP